MRIMSSIKIFYKNKKYFASAFLYSCFSLIFSTWVTYIPHISEKLEINEGKIGNAIFFSALGAFFMIRICRHLIDRVGVGRYAYFALISYCICFFGPFLAYNYISLCVSLFIFGMAGSSFAISLNSLTATIEKQDNLYVMSGSHGFWSIGGMIGAATGSFIAALVQNPILHISVLVLLILFVETRLKNEYYFRRGDQLEVVKKRRSAHIKPLFLIALIGLVIMVSEGAIADWSALYLKKVIQIDLKFIGLGYAAFACAMMIGRFSGDSLSRKLGSWKLITVAIIIGMAGFVLVLIYNPLVSILGFFVIGLGFSVVVPEVYRLASNVEGIKTADAVSFVAATTNIGFMLGPVVLGYIAEMRTLHLSFMVLTAFVSIALFISIWKLRSSKSGLQYSVTQ
jgi:fucose permease